MRAIAKLDPYFERTNKLASRRLKREIERRETLGEFALKPVFPLKRLPTEESSSAPFSGVMGPMLLRSPARLSRRRALCRAARLTEGGADRAGASNSWIYQGTLRRLRDSGVRLPAGLEAGWGEYRHRRHGWELELAGFALYLFRLRLVRSHRRR